MDPTKTMSQQDIMLERLAKWKAERAQKKCNTDYRMQPQKATNSAKRQPLKESRQMARPHDTNTTKKQQTSTNKSLKRQALSLKPTPGPMKSNKRSNLNISVEKPSAQEMSMREKLELWKAQKQQSAKKNPSSQHPKPAPKKKAPSSNLARVIPSSGKFIPPGPLGCKQQDDEVEKRVGFTPNKHLFKTSTSVRRKTHRSAEGQFPTLASEPFQDENPPQKTKGEFTTTEPHHTAKNDTNKDHLPFKRTSPRAQGGSSRKRKTVSFLTTTTPMRCSPRLLKRSNETPGVEGHNQANELATPKQPWQDKKLDMEERLERWLASKGKTPSRYSHLLGFKKTPADRIRRKVASRRATPARATTPVWQLDSEPPSSLDSSINQDQEELTAALNNTMDECFLLLQSDCPTEYVSEWLDGLVGKVPAMQQCAKYWLCRITIAQEEGRDAYEIIHIYEEAVREGAQPIQEVKDSLQQYVTKLINPLPSTQAVLDTSTTSPVSVSNLEPPTPRGYKDPIAMQPLLQSSVLRYCLTESTPYFDRIRTAIGQQVPPTTPGLRLVTPVRRSIRLEGRRSVLPLNLQDHDVCLASLEELPSTGPQEFILRTNRALEGEFSDEQD